MSSFDDYKKRWEQEILAPVLKKAPERKEHFATNSGIDVPRVALPKTPDEEYVDSLGLPGDYPYTRGVQPTGYRGRLWTMRQYAGFGTAEESNQRYQYLLNQGTTGLSVAFDLPTQMGYDSDAPQSLGEVGRTGVAIDCIEDMRVLFNGIPLDKVSTSMTINATAGILLALYIAVAEEQGVPRSQLRGTIQNDILKEYMARGTYIYPPKPSMRLITDIFAFCSAELPRWNTISISGYHIREAGCTAAQEIAFTLADGMAYEQAALSAGLAVDEFAPRLAFFFNGHNNFLEEVAKFRAARRLWASIMRDRFEAKNPKSLMLRFHTQVAGSMLTAQQPVNNVARVTIQALAAVLGGTNSLHTNALDEALALPTEDSVRVALRTQQIIAQESGVAESVDPLAGSYLIESMTDQLEQKAREYIDRIDEMGGMVSAIEQGYPQREIQDAAYAWQRAIEDKEQIIVGVNEYTEGSDYSGEILKIDPELERKKLRGLAAFKSERDAAAVESALNKLKADAQGDENLMPVIVEAVKTNATLGEISDTLREVFGEYHENVVV